MEEYKLEVCVDSVESACNAESGGASRIELCQCLGMGGLTPSIGLLKEVKKAVKIPVFVLIRPRSGDFVFTKEELMVMEADIDAAVINGADGIVIGVLDSKGNIDAEACKTLIAHSKGLPVTFHRAFDVCCDFSMCLEQVIELGCKRMITSGGEVNAFLGRKQIQDLLQRADSRIIIVPAGGINEENVAAILKKTGASEFHCSASIPIDCQYPNPSFCQMFGSSYLRCSRERVADILKIAKRNVL